MAKKSSTLTLKEYQAFKARECVRDLLRFIGDNPDRPGLKDTPERVIKMYQELFCGYDPKRKPKMTVFKNRDDGLAYKDMIRNSGYFFSFCEHHMACFFGNWDFAYIPDECIIGLSKIDRIVDYYSGKLQVAERLVHQIADDLEEVLKPKGLILVMNARHMCKEMRGVKKINSPAEVITVRGVFAKNINGCKDEFMSRIQGR
ncbi:GTP cyclohydrolase I [Patescibacteria group bacterium]|uniref:GTP cyclohydrolase I n=1 Tax=viral metagenome TaxID=1070528 RepID=A0A6M3M8R4_9ZZZZ|nr:GTP cyclohydrolase I [Patescibacteria group bacterium]MBU0847519.1 GTP cyclohydrolase I [Patescibacteria group bacterium]